MDLTKLMMLPMLALLFALEARGAGAAQQPADTIRVIENPDRVIVVRDSTTTVIWAETLGDDGAAVYNYEVNVEEPTEGEIDLEGTSWDIELPFVRINEEGVSDGRGRRKRGGLSLSVIGAGHIYMGQRFNYNDKSGIKNSYEFGIRNLIGVKWSRGGYCPDFSVGFGISRQRYGAQRGLAFGKEGSRLILMPVDEDTQVRHTSLDVMTFQIPVMLTQPIGRDVQLMLGATACFNTYAKAHTEIARIGATGAEVRHKTEYKGLQQRLLTADVVCALGLFESVGVYASWSPVPLFQSSYGPALKAWSIGVTLNF